MSFHNTILKMLMESGHQPAVKMLLHPTGCNRSAKQSTLQVVNSYLNCLMELELNRRGDQPELEKRKAWQKQKERNEKERNEKERREQERQQQLQQQNQNQPNLFI